MAGIRAAIAAVVALWAMPARAAWLEASTAHFVIDADTTEPRIRDFAARLERFDAALRYTYGIHENPSLRSNRVRVYATTRGTIVSLAKQGSNVAGFYHARAGGSVIFTSLLSNVGGVAGARNLDLDSQEVLLHEYSHHFMYSNFPNTPFPLWFSEGFADFNANVLFEPNGDIYLGLPANYRAYGLRSGMRLPARTLLAPSKRDLDNEMLHELVYGRGWLLMHYVMLDPKLRPQMVAYQNAIAAGTPSLAAGQAAFGDLGKLDGALDRYLDRKLNLPFFIHATATPPTVEVRPLSPGAAAMMLVHMRSTAGVDAAKAARIYPDAVARAAPFPTDPRVQVELAEAAYDAGHDDEADAAATRALAADPALVDAMLYKGRVALRRLASAKVTDADKWREARRWFAKANRADTEAAMPLVLYYTSYLTEGVPPPPLAVDGLVKAQELGPEDAGVRFLLARQYILDGKLPDARRLLQRIAYAPHGEAEDDLARKLIELIDAGKADEVKAALPKPDDKGDTPAS